MHLAGMIKKFLLTFLPLLQVLAGWGQSALYTPLLGHVDMRTAYILVTSEKAEEVVLRYFPTAHPDQTTTLKGMTSDDLDHSYKFVLMPLEPGTSYTYQLGAAVANAPLGPIHTFTTSELWQWRHDPPALRLLAGSCAYINETAYDRPGKPYGANYAIFDSMATKKPNMMLWLGDNVYLREADYGSKEGIHLRYQHTRRVPEIQHLLAACPNYAIWDDHDFGPNDSNGSFALKDAALDCFSTYWANPSYGTNAVPGIFTSFSQADIDFFLLDNRYNKTPADIQGVGEPTILGEEQLRWFVTALKSSKAPFKIVALGGQFLNTHVGFENYSTYPTERQRLLDAIEKNEIKNVIFLTGDRHCGELSSITLKNGVVVYDLTTSPLTSRSYDISKENNTLRVEGTLVATPHYAQLDFQGPQKSRTLTIQIIDWEGKTHYTKTIASQL
jgi:alkaline phosphatase D